MIEVAADADAAGAGRPDREIDAADAFESLSVRAKFVVSVVVAAFAHEVQIEFAENEREGVSIELLEGGAGGKAILKAAAGGGGAILLGFREGGFKESVGTELLCFDDIWLIKETNGGRNRAGIEHANHPAATCGRVDLMRTEQREWIGVAADDERVNGLIELRFRRDGGWGGEFSGALFGQEERLRDGRGFGAASLAGWRHVVFDSRALRGDFQEV